MPLSNRPMPHLHRAVRRLTLVGCIAAAAAPIPVAAQAQQALDRTRDRGPGIAVSMFGTYVSPGELLFYPFLEYYHDRDAEYSPAELGYGHDLDYRGEYRGIEGLIFFGYGISDRFAVEFEAAVISARQDKAPNDTSAMPDRLEQSGLGDVEGQLRWLWARETESRPEFFSYFETVLPIQKKKKLIGTQDWEFKLGAGMIRGFRWGTTTVRLSVIYDEGEAGTGEYAVEYLKRISSLLKVFAAVEGEEDEVDLITETQWSVGSNMTLKVNNAFGLTSKAAGWSPELGLLFRFD
jgi:hypothetical protein